jgi:hypothetical protein
VQKSSALALRSDCSKLLGQCGPFAIDLLAHRRPWSPRRVQALLLPIAGSQAIG